MLCLAPPLHSSPLQLGEYENAKRLLQAGADPSEAGNVAMVQALLKAGADIEAKARDGRTPLHISALNGHTDVF